MDTYEDPTPDETEESLAIMEALENKRNKAMLNGEDEYAPQSLVQKPGASIHSQKWDDCIENAKKNNPKGNVYAICTAALGEESFKSEHRHKAYIKNEVRKARIYLKDQNNDILNQIDDLEDEYRTLQTEWDIARNNKDADAHHLIRQMKEISVRIQRLNSTRTNLQKMGIAEAGAVPNSLLAEQDLEPESKEDK